MGCHQSLPTEVIDQIAAAKTSKLDNSESLTTSRCTSRTNYSSSTVSLVSTDEDVSYLLPKVDYNGHLLKEEIVRRTSSSIQSSALSLGRGAKTFELLYSYRSQRGYNAQEPLKPNQDKHGITLNFASEGGDAIVGVYSGHGEKGKQCANFCQVVLPQQLAKFIRQKRVQRYTNILKAQGKMKQGAWNPKLWPLLSTSEYEQCCKRAFHETKRLIQQKDEINGKSSGTSALTISFHGGRMYVCSLGGCGAILGRRISSSSPLEFNGEEEKCEIDDCTADTSMYRRAAIPLSAEHTTRCEAELERIKLAGAEIKESDPIDHENVLLDLDGQGKDKNEKSLHIFAPGEAFPDIKFTRSICDNSLEEIGLLPEPNVVSCDLTANDDILVMASNGVLEVLTNQEIMDICSNCHDPQQASEAVTKVAYEKWIGRTNRCDDLTVIVSFLSNIRHPSESIGMLIDSHVMVDDEFE